MQQHFLQVADSKDPHIKALEAEYEKRIGPFAKLHTDTVKASSKDERDAVQEEEKDKLLRRILPDVLVIALDERGEGINSQEFSALIRKERDFGSGKIQYIIGGSHGLHPSVLAKADKILSLSKMTFTHEMVRVFLKEQIYRAFTLLAGKSYHK